MGSARAIGLDIGAGGVRAAQLAPGRQGTVLRRFGYAPLPPGAVIGGEVVDPAAVTAAIKTLWRENRFDSKHVILGVANARVLVRPVEVPVMSDAEMVRGLPFQVADQLPMAVETSVLDFHPTETFTAPTGVSTHRGLLVAAARDMVLTAVRAVEAAGLRVDSVDLTPFAVLRSIGEARQGRAAAEALVDVGAQVTTVIVHSGGLPRFVRILARGGDDVTDAVSEALGVDAEEAEELKMDAVLDPGSDDDVSRAVAEGARDLLDELVGSLEYYATTFPDQLVDRVVLCGGGSLLGGFAEQLSREADLPVHLGDPLEGMSTGKVGRDVVELDRISAGTAAAVGLALGAA